jgi:hypothetical protein
MVDNARDERRRVLAPRRFGGTTGHANATVNRVVVARYARQNLEIALQRLDGTPALGRGKFLRNGGHDIGRNTPDAPRRLNDLRQGSVGLRPHDPANARVEPLGRGTGGGA